MPPERSAPRQRTGTDGDGDGAWLEGKRAIIRFERLSARLSW